jgi:hypothetical protein
MDYDVWTFMSFKLNDHGDNHYTAIVYPNEPKFGTLGHIAMTNHILK